METVLEVKVPDIGEFKDVDVIEVMVKPGDTVGIDDPLIAIESEKATMEVPAPLGGVIKDIKVKLGDKVSEGSLILTLEAADAAAPVSAASPAPAAKAAPAAEPKPPSAPALRLVAAAPASPANGDSGTAPNSPARGAAPAGVSRDDAAPVHKPHASPSVRKFARELGVDLVHVKGSGQSGRIFRVDVQKFVSAEMSRPQGSGGAGLDLLPWPKVDFAKFGAIESQPLSRIRRFSKANLARNWVMIPHVTQFDEADVTELEAFRLQVNQSNAKSDIKVTMLAFILKALVAVLTEFPEFNSSLDGDNLILKKYFHLGFAADTPNGLVVPVLRDVDKKGVMEIARATAELAATAREGKLKMTDIQGGCFTVSSLGGIGGTAFTPIINAPEVAILGVSRLAHKPVYRDGAFVPRLILPLSLSYDHRVIDGAMAARFITRLSAVLSDLRRALL
ncbi:MAG: dihydrolipoyllysine-residue acetyltransferase [Candidatus Binataceae bacterium]|jgi:pyruvate dehydrogenase E2 component (dihydrolipoamide acetyltransferase)